MSGENHWMELHQRATALRRTSFALLVTGCAALAFTMFVVVATIRRLDDYNDSVVDDGSGMIGYFGSFSPEAEFLDYATAVSSATSTYALVTVVLFAAGYVVRALGLMAEVAVTDLDLGLEADDH